MNFSGPTWRRPGQESVLLASRRYDGSTSRKTKGSMADTLQCNLWRRAQTPHRMTHSLHGGKDTGLNNGFTAIGKRIGTKKQSEKDSEYIKEHSVIKYLRFRAHPGHVLVWAGGAPVPFPGEERHERTIRVGLCSWTATAP